MNTHDAIALTHTDQSVSPVNHLWRRADIVAYGVGSHLVGVVALVALLLVMLGALPFTGGSVHIASPARAAIAADERGLRRPQCVASSYSATWPA
ncbi:MAG: hypothetical protein ACYC7F_06590 [Gemmatimonadaceae bacterium]